MPSALVIKGTLSIFYSIARSNVAQLVDRSSSLGGIVGPATRSLVHSLDGGLGSQLPFSLVMNLVMQQQCIRKKFRT